MSPLSKICPFLWVQLCHGGITHSNGRCETITPTGAIIVGCSLQLPEQPDYTLSNTTLRCCDLPGVKGWVQDWNSAWPSFRLYKGIRKLIKLLSSPHNVHPVWGSHTFSRVKRQHILCGYAFIFKPISFSGAHVFYIIPYSNDWVNWQECLLRWWILREYFQNINFELQIFTPETGF